MLIPIPEEVLQAQARERALDTVLGSLGLSAAAVSASFAAYMAVVGPTGQPAPSPTPLLAVPGPPTHAPRAISGPPAVARTSATPETGGIDFDPTGSISATAAPGQASTTSVATDKAVLPDFAVRDAFDGTALVEVHGELHMVQRGATIDGAGRVLSIERHGTGWVVATTGGLILQRR